MTPAIYLSRSELADRWQMSLKTVDRLRRTGCLPWTDLSGGRGARPIVRFRLTDVESYETAVTQRGDLNNAKRTAS